MKLSWVLPYIVARITNKPRYLPKIVWSEKSWTHNIFRLFELIFWREYGVRVESSADTFWDGYKWHTITTVYTFEAACAYVETKIREALTWRLEFPYKLYIPQLQTSTGTTFSPSPYLFAVAVENAATSSTVNPTPLSFSYTVAGSDTLMWGVATANGPSQNIGGFAYNSLTLTAAQVFRDSGGPEHNLWYRVSPTTGANNVSIVATGSAVAGAVISYSGCSSSQPDASATTNTNATTTSFSASLTSVTDNCWHICTSRCGSAAAISAGAGTTIRNQPEATFFGGNAIWDSNGAKTPAGSVTLNVTSSSQLYGGGLIASFGPPVVASSAFNGFLLMGMGS